MTAATRSKSLDLHEHTTVQRMLFIVLITVCISLIYVYAAVPAMDGFFHGFLRMETIRDGRVATYALGENRADTVTTTFLGSWALIDNNVQRFQEALITNTPLQAAYVFKPAIALFPLVTVGGLVLAAILTILLPGGYVRQKVERELLTVLDRLAYNQYGEHTNEEIRLLIRGIVSADIRKLHDLAEEYNIDYLDLEMLKSALQWHEASGLRKLLYCHDAIKFYMREYFTDRYSNSILGAVYIGAAILIIVIGLRGLKFLPSTDPSMVLGALGLEFMLLITYAVVLMYGRSEDSSPMVDKKPQQATIVGTNASIDDESQQLIRAFLSIERTTKSKEHP